MVEPRPARNAFRRSPAADADSEISRSYRVFMQGITDVVWKIDIVVTEAHVTKPDEGLAFTIQL